MIKKGSHTIVFIMTFAVWLLLTWRLEAFNLLLGALFSSLSTIFFGEFLTVTPERSLQVSRYFWFACFIPVFLWEMVKGNIDVAYRVLSPSLPINPGLVKIKTKLKSEVSKIFLANALTLTPGDTTVDIIGNEIFVHCIDIDRDVQAEADKFEKIIGRIFE